MTVKELLEKHPLLTHAELARLMYPENKYARSRLSNKLNEKTAGSGSQRITEKDIEIVKEVLGKHADDLKIDLSNLEVNKSNG
ncbi:hypothetical protein KRE49_11710 [Elizabethkingia meningoseptica]|nr:hypothetical protein [Elizabethkingia meningoseptica]MDE5526650.1 hypothetical protein [Elizabethkingia meningoseptica]MDN4033737.1 hypothetical protein [Elizabethkingia meningoseptica]